MSRARNPSPAGQKDPLNICDQGLNQKVSSEQGRTQQQGQ